MNIVEQNYKWNGVLTNRKATKYLILHHRAGNGDVQSIHNAHISNGWTGIGYHFYVRKDGTVYRGRPVNTVGAHTTNYNSTGIGICFEGNYEIETMPALQVKAGQELITYLKGLYPNAVIKKHKDFNSTACPGKNFPFDEIRKGVSMNTELTTVNDIVWELAYRGIVTNKELWLDKLNWDEDSYWLARKCANYIRNQK